MDKSFPPLLIAGNRVWSGKGYQAHGPLEGPKVDIPAEMGGVIIGSLAVPGFDYRLYAVEWANGQRSKHYAKELFCIGRFENTAEFEAAIVVEHVRLTVGPFGGYRGADLRVQYDGSLQEGKLYNDNDDEDLWLRFLKPIAERQGAEIETITLPPKPRKNARAGKAAEIPEKPPRPKPRRVAQPSKPTEVPTGSPRVEIPNVQVTTAAEQFRLTAEFLFANRDRNNCVLPLLMVASFGLELYLKALNSRIVYHDLDEAMSPIGAGMYRLAAAPQKRGHPLVALFDSIIPPVREELERAYAEAPALHDVASAREALARYDGLFEDSRYAFEDGRSIGKGSVDGLVRLVGLIGKCVDGMARREL